MSPEAKETVRALGLEDNQSALERVARESTSRSQVRKARELASRERTPTIRQQAESRLRAMGSGRSQSNGEPSLARTRSLLVALRAAWNRVAELNDIWARTPIAVRHQFIAELLNAPKS
jgi:hypothetical protein